MTAPLPDDRDGLLRELGAVAAALADLPADSFEERIDLRDRRDTLRAALAELSPAPSRESLDRELAQLQQRLDDLHRDRPNVAAMSGGGEGDDGVAEAQRLARQFDDGQGRAELEERIQALQRARRALDDDT